MPKHNPQLLKRKEHAPITREFADADNPEFPVTVTWVKITPAAMMQATERATEFFQTYGEHGFPLANESMAPISETTARAVCLFEALQPADLSAEDRYSAGDFVGILENQPDVWFKLQAFSAQFCPDLSDLGNSMRTTG